MNRFAWDLSYPGVEPVKDAVTAFAGNPRVGPKASPGTYSVRVTIDNWTQTQPFEIEADPRLPTSQAEWEEQLELGLQIQGRVRELYDEIRQARSLREQALHAAKRLEERGEGNDGNIGDAARALADKLTAIEVKLMQTKNESRQDPLNFPPRLDAQFLAVYSEVVSSYFRPTDGARQRFRDLEQEFSTIQSELQQVMETDVPAFIEKVQQLGGGPVFVTGR